MASLSASLARAALAEESAPADGGGVAADGGGIAEAGCDDEESLAVLTIGSGETE